jgi:hypothetical protein
MPKITNQEKAVADRLRREIGKMRPEFSEELHARLWRSVQQHRADGAALSVRKPIAGWLFRWASVAAAVSLLAAIGVTWHVMHAVRDAGMHTPAIAIANRQQTGLSNMTELADRVARKADAVADAAAKVHCWGYLEQDARSVLEMPAAKLPFDVVSSFLSMSRQDRTRSPSDRDANGERRHLGKS